jgi:Domain of unknown function (DUF5916)/Carbohydrate family 9 binding domain-like
MRRIGRPFGAVPLILWLAAVAAPSPAFTQDASSIDGPPAPAGSEVVARDAAGRVTIRAIRLTEPLVIDGLLKDPIYSQVPAIGDFVQQEPHEGEPATERTELWIFFDATNIYFAVRCLDSQPDRIIANEMRRDSNNVFQNDNVQLVIDTFYDRRSGVLFQTNALGVISDQEVSDERNFNRDWNAVWDVKAARTEDGWSAEFVIPFKSLRYRAAGPQTWGFNIQRRIPWKNERSYLSGVPASYGGRGIYKLSSAATLVGLEVPPQGRNLELKPYGISAVTTNHQASPAVSNDLTGDAGFDVKYGLTKGLTADVTYNTDFAQVEEDEQQVNLTRFSLFFPEKREFFLEGQGIFGFGPPIRENQSFGGASSLMPIMFFSRQIGLSASQEVPILAGGRVTGRAGRNTVGLLNIETKASEQAGAAATNFSVVRVRRDILRRSAIGLIGTHRTPRLTGNDSNQVVGVDAALAFYQNVTFNSYYARSRTPGRHGDESSYMAQFAYAADRYGMNVEHLTVGDAFNPEIGFLRRESFRRNYAQGRFSPRPRSSRRVRKVSVESSLDYITDLDGRLESRAAQASTRVEFSGGGFWSNDYTRNYELLKAPFEIAKGIVILPGGYSFQDLRSEYYLGPERVSGRVSGSRGSFYGGTRSEIEFNGRVDMTSQFSLEPRVTLDWIGLPVGRFTTRLVGSRVNFTMSTRMAFSALVQYNSSNAALSSNLRFRWEYQPGSDLFVVYSDGRDTVGTGFPKLQNRSFVVKATRLFRF